MMRHSATAVKLQKRAAEHPQMMRHSATAVKLQKRAADHPQMMRHSATAVKLQKRAAEQMMVSKTLQSRRYNRYKDLLSEKSLIYQHEALAISNTSNVYIGIEHSFDSFEANRHLWFSVADSLSLTFPSKDDVYFNTWIRRIILFKNSTINRIDFTRLFSRIPLQLMVQELSMTNVFQKIFWPFSFDQAFMNQKLALLGMSGISTNKYKQKERFYTELEKYQTIKIPVEETRVVLSFDHPDLVEGLNRSGILEMSKEYVDAGKHLYTLEEQEQIKSNVRAAMDMINSADPELYRAIHQVIGCIAFYKAEHPGYGGGTISSALGVIWQDPRAYGQKTVAHYAEQIVHEFIHTSLFLADMVHGTYIDRSLLPQLKVYSPVKKELRDFDKTFHASYVTTGVAIFQSRAGNFEKAKTYAGDLRAAVDGLIAIQNEAAVLNESGDAMLQALDDVLTVIRKD
ncbi:uncharacterized protein LOC128220005 [Mya arenaria]|uniref:uncharacterized protein LOC128220005 n=1 Tax=Mya arenaria TaxID=6604 RepID=UPI0022E2D625|nr:uncharacterized protein LOC128220005 [Mya arenaria]